MENSHSSPQTKMVRLIRLLKIYQSHNYLYGQEVVKKELVKNFTLSAVTNLNSNIHMSPVTLCRIYGNTTIK